MRRTPAAAYTVAFAHHERCGPSSAHADDAAVPGAQEPVPGHPAVLPDGRLLRAVLRRRAARCGAAGHHPDRARPVRPVSRFRWRACRSTPSTATWRGWCARARASRSASRWASRARPRDRSSGASYASSHLARSPTRRCSKSAPTRCWSPLAARRRAFRARLARPGGRALHGAAGRGARGARRRARTAQARGAAGRRRRRRRASRAASTALRTRPPWHFELASASRLLTEQLGTLDLRGFGAAELPLAIRAAGALLQYVRETQKAALPHIRALRVEERGEALLLDAASRRNLELDVSLERLRGRDAARASSTAASPPWARGSCAAGSNRPLTDAAAAARALPGARRAARRRAVSPRCGSCSRGVGDVERILARVALRSRPAARSHALRAALRQLPALRAALARRSIRRCCSGCAAVAASTATSLTLLAAAIAVEPATLVRDGDVIAPGYDAELDELRRIATHTDELPARARAARARAYRARGPEARLQPRAGLLHRDHAARRRARAADYIRRQTVKSAERFITAGAQAASRTRCSARATRRWRASGSCTRRC